jgi:hypothetical protein
MCNRGARYRVWNDTRAGHTDAIEYNGIRSDLVLALDASAYFESCRGGGSCLWSGEIRGASCFATQGSSSASSA